MRHSLGPVHTRLGAKIRTLRQAHDLSLEKLAEMTGTSAKHLGAVERGSANVSLAILAKVAAKLSVSLSELFLPAPAAARRQRTFLLTEPELDQISRAGRIAERARRRRT